MSNPPNLKSASGAGFSFEDKVAALLFCEMLAGRPSLGRDWGVLDRIERQAGDWEPFGDLLLTTRNHEGKSLKCGCSVKSNRQISTNGCSVELRDSLWSALGKPVFNPQLDSIGLFCAQLAHEVSLVIHQLCRQAREEDRPLRLDEKITDQKHRRIYDSFHSANDATDAGLPGQVLARLIPREFDFEDAASRNEADAVALCQEVLAPTDAAMGRSRDLWEKLLTIARELRDVGGSVTREGLASKLRHQFLLRDDPSDVTAWASIRAFSQEWMEQIEINLPGGLRLPRASEMGELRQRLGTNRAFHLIGESGSGKSALAKALALESGRAVPAAEVVWIKADRFGQLTKVVPAFVEVLRRTRSRSGLLIFDSLDACYSGDVLSLIGRAVAAAQEDANSPWKVVLICQSPEWSRISRSLVKELAGHDALTKQVECGVLSDNDMPLVFAASPSIHRLASQPGLYRLLSSPKNLDLLLRGQLAENLVLTGEADLVDWWWHDQVMAGKRFAAEESIVRTVANQMADDLTTEVSPDVVAGPADAVENLLKKAVLRRSRDGRLRFDHDLLADWSRVMHLRSLGDSAVAIMRGHTENPPWLRAIRVLSQHLLERASDLDRWRSAVASCSTRGEDDKEPAAADLQVLDAWLEGIAHCADAVRILESLRAVLFSNDGWLLKRFIRRLLHTGTIPDPVIQRRFQQTDASAAEAAALLFRLPLAFVWDSVLKFLVANPIQTTDFIPVELAEIGAMWARLEHYLQVPWPALADLVLLNGEKELRREIAGEYRHDRGTSSLGGRNSRAAIYRAALQAASQAPERTVKLVLKAAGRIPWEEGDICGEAREGWRGEWQDHSYGRYGSRVMEPIEAWPDGPSRSVSSDFCQAWFDADAPLALYRQRPATAVEATLAFLIEWPKTEIIQGDRHATGIDRHGFRFDGNRMYPPLWTKGPFLSFLRENWKSALDLIIGLTNFATERYEEWWPYQPGVAKVQIPLPQGSVQWKGNHQVYAWNRYHMNTLPVVTCALMALEKWLDDQIAAKKSIADTVEVLWQKGRSLAFAGVLVSIGKRHPEHFLKELKPLLFVREIYLHDLQAVRESIGGGYWPRDGAIVNNLRREWNQLPGRNEWLKDECPQWLIDKPEFAAVMGEVSTAWRKDAEGFPERSDTRLQLLRWAADFDPLLWKEITLPDGRKAWQNQRPEELQDAQGEQNIRLRQALIMLPHQCAELLEKRPELSDEQLEGIWQQLQNWGPYEQVSSAAKEDKEASSEFLDHRHARCGFLAILLCLGRAWLERNPQRRPQIEAEVRRLLADPPNVTVLTEDDNHDDFEGFLARCAIQCWAASPNNSEWRGLTGSFVTAYRYRTVRQLFDEAFRVRAELGEQYRELEALALSFAVARHEATRLVFLRTRRETDRDAVNAWCDHWLPKFANREGPAWVSDWSKIEKLEDFYPKTDASYGMGAKCYELHRRDYGLDMGVVLASFAQLPPLAEARGEAERAHWVSIGGQMLAAFCRTLPAAMDTGEEEWKYEVWKVDEEVFDVVASRMFECKREERVALWQPMLSLPPSAHHHISQFLHAILLASIKTDPARIAELIPIWREMADHLFGSEKWRTNQKRNTDAVWKEILLYGTPFTSAGEEIFAPLVDDLRPLLEWHARSLTGDAHEQSSFAAFLTTKAARALLVDALAWLRQGWETGSKYFWDTAVERGGFEQLLDCAWREHFVFIRANPDALQAFKLLTLNLAARHVPTALQIQQQVGTDI